MKSITRAVLAAWLAVVFLLGAAGAFVRSPGTPPIPIFLGVIVPLIIFFIAYSGLAAFRNYMLAIHPFLAASIQAWRFAGLGFLALYAHGVLPGVFAWPAGLGDIAIGVTAPWVALTLVRRPAFATSWVFMIWNLLGILDLVVAVSVGALSSALASGAAGEVTTGPMAQMPLVLIPAYFVPLFLMLHVTALLQARRQAKS